LRKHAIVEKQQFSSFFFPAGHAKSRKSTNLVAEVEKANATQIDFDILAAQEEQNPPNGR